MDIKDIDVIKVDSVVQVNENGTEAWSGCLVQVTEVKTWGIQGFVQIPMQGAAYIRLGWEDIEYVGEAVMKPQKETNL